MSHQNIMIAVLLAGLFATTSACADDGQTAQSRPATYTVQVGTVKASGPGPFTIFTDAPRTIVNAPYSAQMVTEHQQKLADGNQIVDRQTSMSYRDNAGRSRQESLDSKGEPSAAPTGIGQRKRADGDGSAKIRIETRQGPMADAGAMRDMKMRMAPLAASMFGDKKWMGQTDGKKLGMREIGGVQAEGTMHSYEIPAGQIGNRNPIVVTDESWYAPHLQITVYTKHSDPRSGDVEFRVEKLKREQPPATLFTVPADHKVRDVLAAAGGQGR